MAPDQPPDPLTVALAVAAIFERLGIRYVAGGSLASSLHGEPRSTVDIDLVADLRPAHVAPLLAALLPEHYVSEEAVQEAVRTGGSFNAIHLPTAVKVDVFVAGQDPFDAERLGVADLLARARREAGPRYERLPNQGFAPVRRRAADDGSWVESREKRSD